MCLIASSNMPTLAPRLELAYFPLIFQLPPSPPPPEPHPGQPEPQMQPQLVNVQQAEEAVVEDPHPTNVQDMLPPIARAAAMHEQVGEQAKDASTQAKVAQRLLPSYTQSELLGLSSADLRHLSPEQYVLEQQHLLMPDPMQASLDEAAPSEAAATSMDEIQHLWHLAAREVQPRLIGFVRHNLADIPQMPSLERLSVTELEEVFGEAEEEPVFEIDLGAFELVDTGISAEELLTNEDPVIYHKDLPVHSVHHDTVQTEAAIQNMMNAPQSMLSSQIPPTMVADNYCFAVDGDRIQMADILGDEHWWRHTSRPTKYFYSEDLRRFYRVNLLTVRGKIVSARLANTTPAMGANSADMMAPELQQAGGSDFLPSSSFSLPGTARRSLTFCTGSSGRPSFVMPSADPTQYGPSTSAAEPGAPLGTSASLSLFPPPGTTIGRHSIAPISLQQKQPAGVDQQQSQQWRPAAQPEMAQRGESVELGKVYRVVRFYSFWRTCTAFHRIVTMIERVGQPPMRSQSQSKLGQRGVDIPPISSAHSDSSSSAAKSRPGSSSSRPPPEFQKRLFVQYLWRNIKSGDKARVQREFDPRRQRLLKYVADSAARKRMTGAKMQFRSGSAGSSAERQQRLQATPPPGTGAALQSPSSHSARGSIRFRLPSDQSTSSAPQVSTPRRTPRPHSSPGTPVRRAKPAIEIGSTVGSGRSGRGTPVEERAKSPRK